MRHPACLKMELLMKACHKRNLRTLMKDRRATLFHNQPEAGERIVQFFFDFFHFPSQTRIGAYWPIGSELDVRPLLHALVTRGFRCALPCMESVGISFREWDPSITLREGKFQTFEPLATAPRITPEILLVPLLAFDQEGHRLGYGQGSYDRYLSDHKALTIGVGFQGQELEKIPHQPHDCFLDYILTEAGVIVL